MINGLVPLFPSLSLPLMKLPVIGDRQNDSRLSVGIPSTNWLHQLLTNTSVSHLQYAAALASLSHMNAQASQGNIQFMPTSPLKSPKSHNFLSEPSSPTSKKLKNEVSPSLSARKRQLVQATSELQQDCNNSSVPLTSSQSKRSKTVRKLMLEEDKDTLSPVSGMYIRDASDCPPADQLQMEMDETAKFVEMTDETRAALAKIPNIIGDYVCALCSVKFMDAFRLAQHRCPRIVHEEYRCPECDKVFSCPANLASHRRWHKPKQSNSTANSRVPTSNSNPRNSSPTPTFSSSSSSSSNHSPNSNPTLSPNSTVGSNSNTEFNSNSSHAAEVMPKLGAISNGIPCSPNPTRIPVVSGLPTHLTPLNLNGRR